MNRHLTYTHPYTGFYASSKSAFVTLSETLRLELQPLGVGVATVIVGAVSTNIFANMPAYKLPANSRYGPVEKQIQARATGNDVSGQKDTAEDFARKLVGRVLSGGGGGGGASGRIACGKLSTAVQLLTTYFPTWVVVSLPPFFFRLVYQACLCCICLVSLWSLTNNLFFFYRIALALQILGWILGGDSY